MPTGLLTIHLRIPGCSSLKEKRSHVKPVIHRLHREFNVSAAEIDRNDSWQETVIGCAIVSNDAVHCQKVLQQVVKYIEKTWPDLLVIDEHIEYL